MDGSLAAQGDCVPEVLLTDLRVGLSGEIVEDVRKTRSTSHIGTYVTAVVTYYGRLPCYSGRAGPRVSVRDSTQ